MTGAEFARLVVEVCHLALPPGITPDRLRTYAQVESSLNPAAVSRPNRDGSRDYGLMQMNSQWIGRTGFPATVAEAMEPCANIAAGIRILADADRQAACIYNSGKPNCRNGYPERIQAASATQPSRPAPLPLAPAPTALPPAPHSWDVWAMPAPQPAPAVTAGSIDAPSADEPRVIVELRKGD